MKIAVLTLYTDEIAAYGTLSAANKAAYAARHGYDFLLYRHALDPDRHPAWSKVLALRESLPRYDWVFWSDADSLVMNPAVRLESIIRRNETKDMILTSEVGAARVNTGQWLVRNTPWSAAALREIAEAPFADARPKWFEQGALIAWLADTPERWEHLAVLHPRVMNSTPGRGFYPKLNLRRSRYRRGDFIIHFWPLARRHAEVGAVMETYYTLALHGGRPRGRPIFRRRPVTAAAPKSDRPILVVTPTYDRPKRLALLERCAATFRRVPNLLWIVVEDSACPDQQVARFLNETCIPHVYLGVGPTRAWGNAQRNLALGYVREHRLRGVVYLADDDNLYEPPLFEEIRRTKRVSVVPVGLLGPSGIERPKVRHGRIVGWIADWKERRFPVDMAGFAFDAALLDNLNGDPWTYEGRGGETEFLERVAGSPDDLEVLCDGCRSCYVWHDLPLGVPVAQALRAYRAWRWTRRLLPRTVNRRLRPPRP